jgi:hypothetical protein
LEELTEQLAFDHPIIDLLQLAQALVSGVCHPLINVNSSSGFQPRDARLKSTKIVSRASRGSRFYPFVELTSY